MELQEWTRVLEVLVKNSAFMDRLQHNPRAVIRTRAKLNYDMVRGPKADTKPCEAIIPGLSQIGRVNDFLTAIGFVYSIYIYYIYI